MLQPHHLNLVARPPSLHIVMPSQPEQSQKRFEPGRSATWPQTKRILRVGQTDFEMIYKTKSAPAAIASLPTKPVYDPYEDELNKHPEDHFLSPVQMYEYEDWAEDSDDDAEEVEWDAGITDFALFDNDRRRAQEQHEQVPGRWNGLIASQASALQRAVERNRAGSEPRRRAWTPLLEELPQLTPDSSPDLRGDFDIHAHCGPRQPQQKQKSATDSRNMQNFPSFKITPPSEDTFDSDEYDSDYDYDDDESEDDSDLPVSWLVERSRAREQRRRAQRKLERPGLRSSRTLSGKVHVWRRPSHHIYSVGEDVEAEKKAEMLCSRDEHRGRGRG